MGWAMDQGFIDMCVRSYEGKLEPADEARLRFFQGLWAVMGDAIAQREGADLYPVPPLERLKELYGAQVPVFDEFPCKVDTARFAATAHAIAGYLIASGMYDPGLCDALESLDWAALFAAQGEGGSGEADRDELLESLADALGDAEAAQLAGLVASLALYTFYEGPAHAVMEAIGYDPVIDTHPLHCPVCGGEPTLASVGAKTSSAGRGRQLYCLNCGAAWEFDRIRCAHCGTRDQTKLRYVAIEGDPDHQLALCDECGGFMRTTFLDGSLFPLSPLVEDVVMAPLAAVGLQHALEVRGASL